MAYESFTPAGKGKKAVLHDSITAPAASNNGVIGETNHSIQCTLQGTGAVTATINIDYSNDGIGWLEGPQIVISGTTLVTDGFASNDYWAICRATLVSITGTGASLTTTLVV